MTRRRIRGAVVGIAILALAAGDAAAAARPQPAPGDVKTVEELVVTAFKTVGELTVTAPVKCLGNGGGKRDPPWRNRPRVVGMFPARGKRVRPGLLIVRLTFDQKMACDGGFAAAIQRSFPCPFYPPHMLLSYDRRTIRTICYVWPKQHYGARIDPYTDWGPFKSLDGTPAAGGELDFTTSDQAPIDDACEALMEDPVSAAEMRGGKHYCGAEDE